MAPVISNTKTSSIMAKIVIDDGSFLQSIYDRLVQRSATTPVTYTLIGANVLVFIAMLFSGAGFWHSPSDIQLKWGANFGPATQDGEWWRLFTAMYLHFGIMHLSLNCLSLWESGQLVERMYGRWRFVGIYLTSGLFGNLLSLVAQGNVAVSGGASGAIFGVYGAALIFLWRERAVIDAYEFRWLFGGGVAFSILTIVLGYIITGIDNYAHIGGLIAGMLASIYLSQSIASRPMPAKYKLAAFFSIFMVSVFLITHLPKPKYRWSDELLLRSELNKFLYEDQAINRMWLEIEYQSKQGDKSFEALAKQIDFGISKPYEQSLEKLSKLPNDPALPSANQLENILRNTEIRKQQADKLVKGLKKQQQLSGKNSTQNTGR
jgi:rhomboid protease GluP